MKVLFLSNIPTPNQLDFVKEVNKYLDLKYVLLYTTEKGRDWDLELNDYTTVLNYKHRVKEYIHFYKIFKEYNPDIVLVGGYSLYLSSYLYILSKIFKKKFVYTLEKPNKSSRYKNFLKDLYFKIKFTFVKPDLVLAIGKKTSSFYSNYFSKVENFPYSMNLEKYYVNEKRNNNINFLFCGQLINRKNILNVIEAFSSINDSNINLNILGSGELINEVKQFAKKDLRINLLGFVEPKDIYNIYTNNDIFILPSLDDGWALVINEAMASSMPIIGTKEVGAIEEFIIHKENGFICEIEKGSIKEGFEYYINNTNLIKNHGEKNMNIIKKSMANSKNSAIWFKELMENL